MIQPGPPFTMLHASRQQLPEEYEEEQLQQSYQQALKEQDPMSVASNSFVTSSYNENLIQWQLELDSILERIEHMLRGDKPTWKNGSIVWVPSDDDKEKIFNDFGVAEIMRILSNYVNRNTILSNYREETINDKMLDLGNEMADLIYMKYEKMFVIPTFENMFEEIYGVSFEKYFEEYLRLNINEVAKELFGREVVTRNGKHYFKVTSGDRILLQELSADVIQMAKKRAKQDLIKATMHRKELLAVSKAIELQSLEKRKLYPMIVRELIDVVHSSYLRALHGGERESLREARQVTQLDRNPSMTFNLSGENRPERGFLNPMRYLGGRYK